MNVIRIRFSVLASAATLSLAISSAVTLGANCTAVEDTCDGWTAENPKLPGYCCTTKYAKAKECTSGVASVTIAPNVNCGRFAPITQQNCGNSTQTGCGSAASVSGCTTGNCTG